jgi:hypothetical protein
MDGRYEGTGLGVCSIVAFMKHFKGGGAGCIHERPTTASWWNVEIVRFRFVLMDARNN